MDKYVVEITDEALADMDGIYNYIANTLLAPENAIGQYHRIAEAILTGVQDAAFDINGDGEVNVHDYSATVGKIFGE